MITISKTNSGGITQKHIKYRDLLGFLSVEKVAFSTFISDLNKITFSPPSYLST